MNAPLRWAQSLALWLLLAGIGASVGVLLCRNDTTILVGITTLYVAVLLSLVAWALLAVGCWLGVRARPGHERVGLHALRVAFVLLLGYAGAAGMVVWMAGTLFGYEVRVVNEGNEVLEHVRFVGPGCEQVLGDVVPGSSTGTSLSFRGDGELTFRGRLAAREIVLVVDDYVTPGLGGSKRIVVGPDGSVRVHDERR